ncbi:MAG: methionine--tRNA ligase subunit beta [Flavobacterium sp.]|nr:methionine--tRNA ligase subunit beta [Flavobacterium sp.]
MTTPKRYLITAALPYANGLKHIGHLAGAYLPADIYVRYLKAQKRDVVFVCGSDEHGTAIPIQAMKEGTTAQAIIDKYHPIIQQNFKDLGIQFDIYHRTSSPLHHQTAQEFFTILNNNNDLEIKESEQYYDEATNTFLADRYIKGTCPVCANSNAFGDQCEKCGSSLSPDQLINPVSTLSGNQPVKKATKHWYLPLDRHEAFLREWILETHKNDWRASVVGQCKSWIDGGLQARAVTRDLDWGIKVPTAPLPHKGGIKEPQDEKTDYDYMTADPLIYGLLKDFVKEHRSNPTESEIVLWEMLCGKKLENYKFRRQHIIGIFIADFVCLSKKLIIEVDGNIHQLPKNIISDEERTKELNKLGFEVIRFSKNEVLFETEKVLAFISEKLKKNAFSEGAAQIPILGGEGAGKVLYVWFDAPIGYISATKQWAKDNDKDWAPYWNDKDTKLVHFIGKDNIVFHCIIFPVMLKLHGNILPTNVPANEFMNLEGDKMSTSRGWSIEMDDYINDWVKPENGGQSMADVLRYYLTQIAPESKDSEFTWKGFQLANNSELVNVFGNFVNRTFVLMHKLCKGKVPVFHNDIIDDKDKQLIADIKAATTKIEQLLEGYKFRDALFEVIDLAGKGNKYLQEKEPWKQSKGNGQQSTENQKNVDNCIHLCLQLTANLAILIHPFLPFTAKKLCSMMKVVDRMLEWENAGNINLLKVGYSLREPQLLFRKIENEEIEAQLEKLKQKTAPNPHKGVIEETSKFKPMNDNETANQKPPLEAKEAIVFDDFAKIDLRVGTIVSAEKVEKADKLLKLSVDLGFETRTIVSGIALHFKPEEVVGKQVTVVVNLAPRKMRGIDSNGMILMAEDNHGKLHFVNPESEINEGAGVS